MIAPQGWQARRSDERGVRWLATVVLWLAAVVLVASVLPYTGFVPRRSLWSMGIGATLFIASTIELGFVLTLAFRLSKAHASCSPFAVSTLVLGIAASMPAIRLAFA